MKMFKKILVLAAVALFAGSMFVSCGDKYAEAKNAFLKEYEGYVKQIEGLVEGDTEFVGNTTAEKLMSFQSQIAAIGINIESMDYNPNYNEMPDPSTWTGEFKERWDELENRFNELMESANKQLDELQNQL